MRRKLTSWKTNFLSQSGRLVLAKSTLNAIPTYTMQYFKLPKNICHFIDQIQRDFLWGSSSVKRKIYYVGWGQVTKPKVNGGLGLCDCENKNKAIFTRLSWRMFTQPSSPWARTLVSKYNNWHQSSTRSFIWKNILLGGVICNKSTAWAPASGAFINVWSYRWIPNVPPLRQVLSGPLHRNKDKLRLSDIWNGHSWEWEKISFDIPLDIIHRAAAICPSNTLGNQDKPYWALNPNGLLSTKLVYLSLISHHVASAESFAMLTANGLLGSPTKAWVIQARWLMLRNLGNLAVRHNFRLDNTVADSLAKAGSHLLHIQAQPFLVSPPPTVKALLQHDRDGASTSILVSWPVCHHLVSLGNQSVKMYTSRQKIHKDKDAEPSEFEESVAQALFDLENTNQELKSELKDLYINSAAQIDVSGNRKAVVIHVPYRLRKAFRKVHVRLVRELEKKFSGKDVIFIATRRIVRPPKRGSAAQRPRSRTLTSVHDAILEDLVVPAEIVGKRTRYRVDGSKIMKVYLDPKERNNTEYKLETFSAVYRKLSGKDVVFEFPHIEA
ncbi:40S ribosomal protein S7 [Capsicum chinense]|nr:40S ribosomal protein S7 [Capsicum chinense]